MVETQIQQAAGQSGEGRAWGDRLNSVYVARTVEMPQPEFEDFLNTFGRHLSGRGRIYTLGSTHMTFLSSTGIGQQFRMDDYSPGEVRRFRDDLQKDLDESLFSDAASVEVNADKPLQLVNSCGKIALSIEPSEPILQQRAETEAFLKWRFGRLPRLGSFLPHISVGFVRPDCLTKEEQANPSLLLPEGLHVPHSIALNGLTTYLATFPPRRSSL
jgi:hypothetical protein